MNIAFLKSLAFSGGDWVIYILILCSVLAVAVILERSVFLARQKLPMDEAEKRLRASWKGDADALPALFADRPLWGRVAQDLAAAGAEGANLSERLGMRLDIEKRHLERRLLILATLGNNAPFVGLLGTVLGIIKAFHDLSQNAGAGPEAVMAGLSEALIATAVGILVAIPCVVAYNVLVKHVKNVLVDLDHFGRRFIGSLERESVDGKEKKPWPPLKVTTK